MLSKTSKWELGFVHYIVKFIISRFVISRFEYIFIVFTRTDKLKIYILLYICTIYNGPNLINNYIV